MNPEDIARILERHSPTCSAGLSLDDVARRAARRGGRGVSLYERAVTLHARACSKYPFHRLRGVAYPFGRPPQMPAHKWIVSPDIRDDLYAAMPNGPLFPTPIQPVLLGWPVVTDRNLPFGTMRLEEG